LVLSDTLHNQNYSRDNVPTTLHPARMFLLDNPVTPGGWLRNQFSMRERKACEQRALGTLVELFGWLDGLEPQSAMEIISLYEMSLKIGPKANKRAREVEIDRLMIILKKHSADMDAFSDFEQTVDIPVLKQQPTITRQLDDRVLVDEDMKKKWGKSKDEKERTAILIAFKKMVHHYSDQITNCATGDLVQLVEQCAHLSLAGRYSAQVRSTIRLLEGEQNKVAMGWLYHGVYEPIELMERLDHMRRKLELIEEVERSVGIGGKV